jgi:hypothetical protein
MSSMRCAIIYIGLASLAEAASQVKIPVFFYLDYAHSKPYERRPRLVNVVQN